MSIFRRRLMMGQGEPEQKPYDSEVEYLQSDGNQYIDTGIILTSKIFDLHVDCAVMSGQLHPTVLGAIGRSGTSSIPLAYNDDGHPYTQIGSNYVKLYDTNKFGSTIVHYRSWGDGSRIYISDGNVTQNQSVGRNLSSLTMYMFARHRYDTGVGNYAVAKIGKMSISINGELKGDFIPVRIGNVGYMYDKVSKQLFGNDGTGDFILGGDI